MPVALTPKRFFTLAVVMWSLCAVPVASMEEDTEAEADATEAAEDSAAAEPAVRYIDGPRYGISDQDYAEQWLAGLVNRQQVFWLSTTPDEEFADQAESFLALYQPQQLPQAQGGALILHGRGEHLNFPGPVRFLRESLPGIGWSSLSIALLDVELPGTPERAFPVKKRDVVVRGASGVAEDTPADETETAPEETGEPPADDSETSTEQADADADIDATQEPAAAEAETETDNATAETDADVEPTRRLSIAERNQLRIDAAIQFLQQQGVANVALVGHNAGAAWAMDYFARNQAGLPVPGYVLALINAAPPFGQGPVPFTDFDEGFAPPVLDLYDRDIANREAWVDMRRNQAGRGQFENYSAMRVPTLRNASARALRDRLLERLQQWLLVHAPGEETPAP